MLRSPPRPSRHPSFTPDPTARSEDPAVLPLVIDVRDPAVIAAGLVVLVAAVQLVLSRWRDLGPLTVAAGGALVAVAPGPVTWGAVSVAAGVAAAAWARGGRRGVGHPALVAAVLGVTIAANAALAAAGRPEHGAVAAAAIGVVGAIAQALALVRPGARRPAVRWVGEVRVT